MTPPCRVCKEAKGVLCYPTEAQDLAICPDCCATAQHPDGETGHVWEYDKWEKDDVCQHCGIQKRCTPEGHNPHD